MSFSIKAGQMRGKQNSHAGGILKFTNPGKGATPFPDSFKAEVYE